jgi:cell division septation protein DedD
LRPNAANVDKESASWTLSWESDGRCNSFTREAILACAPPTSGVYGLFNFDCQVFIGESANIQEALLRHESESDFQSRHLQPTGFTFEPCAVELCRPKVDELIARFHPVLQSEAALSETWSLSNDPMVSKVDTGSKELGTYADHQEFSIDEREKHPKVRRRFNFKRTQAVALPAMLVASALVIFYLGKPTDYAIQKRANGANPTSDQTEIGLRPRNAPSLDRRAGSSANQIAGPATAKPDVRPSVSTPNGAVRVAAKSTDHESVKAKTNPIADSADSANLSKKWSVQISAAAARDVADGLVQRLKAKGYDSYWVQAEVKGQTYYRVRVGHFAARDQAESVRQSLVRQEEYRDAYPTGD